MHFKTGSGQNLMGSLGHDFKTLPIVIKVNEVSKNDVVIDRNVFDEVTDEDRMYRRSFFSCSCLLDQNKYPQ